MQPSRVILSWLALAAPLCAQQEVAAAAPDVTFKHLDGKVRVEIDGELFTEYVYKGWANPILYPLHGAAGIPITRNYPMKRGVATEQTDHPHHRSLWFTHGEINGHDFWAGKGRIEQEKLDASKGDGGVELVSHNRYVAEGEVICRDKRTIVLSATEAGRFIDYEVTITASEQDLLFGDTKEGSMAMRLTPELRLRGKVAAGKIRTSEGHKDKKAWGKRARWVDYYGPVKGEVVGVALFDHPDNHGHPCRWHARDYGLVAANPWGIHHFEGAPKGTGDMKLAKGGSITLRYRFYFHAGSTEDAGVEAQYTAWATPKKAAERQPDKHQPGKRSVR